MTFDLLSSLPIITPKAITWAQIHSESIAKNGQPLDNYLTQVAISVGVRWPERIRIVEVPSLPLPEDEDLKNAAIHTGLLGPNMVGMTLGHSIYICAGHRNLRLFSHEFRHVFQYEQAGSIANFMPTYLEQIARFTYANAPLEIDARENEKA